MKAYRVIVAGVFLAFTVTTSTARAAEITIDIEPVQFPGIVDYWSPFGFGLEPLPPVVAEPLLWSGSANTGTLTQPGFSENIRGTYDPVTGDIEITFMRLFGEALFVTPQSPFGESVPAVFQVGSELGIEPSVGNFQQNAAVDSFFDVFFEIEFHPSPGDPPVVGFNESPGRMSVDTSGSENPAHPFWPGSRWVFSGPGDDAVDVFREDTGDFITEIVQMELTVPTGQNMPIWPTPPGAVDPNPNQFDFDDVIGGGWHDPPVVEGYVYSMSGDSLFVKILDFPTGFDGPFEVIVSGESLGFFGPGDEVDFTSLVGGGVEEFTILGISPKAELGDPAGFPLRLLFDDNTATFTMTAVVPEPASVILLIFGVMAATARRHRC